MTVEHQYDVPMDDSHDPLLTIKQIATMFEVRPDTIRSYKNRHQMPAPDNVFGRTPVWHTSTIRRWRQEPTGWHRH